jgi:hypothetical protein
MKKSFRNIALIAGIAVAASGGANHVCPYGPSQLAGAAVALPFLRILFTFAMATVVSHE